MDAIEIGRDFDYSKGMETKKKSYGKEHDLNLKLLISLSRSLSMVHKETMRNMKDSGLTPSQFMVLEVLYHKGDMRVCEITEKILTSGGNMTVVIQNLMKEDYVVKKATPGDRRSYQLSLTEKGKDIMEEVFPKHLSIMKESMEGLSEEEKKTLITLLKKMQRLDEHEAP